MSHELTTIVALAAGIAFIHTLAGPDHYLPFVAMAQARKWSSTKTLWVTTLCGLGHVMSSVLLGLIGIALGIGISRLEAFESSRGNIAGWFLIGFGFCYAVWGARRALKQRPHQHWHFHEKGFLFHRHLHSHNHEHLTDIGEGRSLTPWILFLIFVFGPCEPLIPILMYPAAQGSVTGLILVVTVFTVVTIGTMVVITRLSLFGFRLLPIQRLERYAHLLAGSTLCVCGLAIQFWGL